MEWFTNIAPSLTGLPWWAVLVVILLTLGLAKGVPALLKYLGFEFEREKYRDAKEKAGYEALIEELKDQVKDLKATVATVLGELRDVRTAHVKCEIEQEKMRGKMMLMEERMDRLMAHDANGVKQLEVFKDAIKEIDPQAKV